MVEEIDCYDFKSESWETLDARQPGGSAAAGVAVLDGRILYFGGETTTVGPATALWTELAHMNQGRHDSQALVYKNKVYIAAGSPVRGGGKTQSMEVFSYK